GYESYYFNVMAGPKSGWHFHNDPAHERIFSAPRNFKTPSRKSHLHKNFRSKKSSDGGLPTRSHRALYWRPARSRWRPNKRCLQSSHWRSGRPSRLGFPRGGRRRGLRGTRGFPRVVETFGASTLAI